MISLFRGTPASSLGIDIGASAFKIVELEKENERYKLKNYGLYSLGKYLQENSYQTKASSLGVPNQQAAEIIKRVIKKARMNSKEAYFSIPVYSSFSTLIDFPEVMSEKEISSAVPFEAKKYVPVPVSEVVLDWTVIPGSEKQSSKQILLLAVPKKNIEDYKEIAKMADIKLKGVEEETFSLARSLVGNDKSSILLIDAGARSINVSIIDNGFIRITHNLETGGLRAIKAIAEKADVSFKEVEQNAKMAPEADLSPEKKARIREATGSVLENIISGIEKVAISYQEKYKRKIEKCLMAGKFVLLPGFSERVASRLSVDISMGDPFARVAHQPALKNALKEIGPSLAVAMGLAMRE